MKFLQFILKHPAGILISMLLVAVLGITSFKHIPIEIRPMADFDGLDETYRLRITALWLGQTAEIMQKMGTSIIEEQCMQMDALQNILTSTTQSRAYLTLEFPNDDQKTYYYIHVREKLRYLQNTDQLPADMELSLQPLYSNDDAQKQASDPFMEIRINGDMTLNQLRRLCDQVVVTGLQSVEAVSDVKVFGGSHVYIAINVLPERLEEYSISPDQIFKQLRAQINYLGLGWVKDVNSPRLLVADNQYQSIEQLAQLELIPGVKLKEVAQLSYEYEKPTTLSRRNHMPMITIQVFKRPYDNALDFSRELLATIDELERELPGSVELLVHSNQVHELKGEIRAFTLRISVILGVILIILYCVFGTISPTFIVLIVSFFTFCITSLFLFLTQYTLNIMTLASIALVLGLLVDNAIVIIENIQFYHFKGESPHSAALHGSSEIFSPLLASSLTTIFVFLALLLLTDRLGNYYHSMAWILGITLLASLLISAVLIPVFFVYRPHLLFIHPSKHSEHVWYQKSIHFLIVHPLKTMMLAISILTAVSWYFFDHIETGNLQRPAKAINTTRLQISAPQGIRFDTLDDMVQSFENIACSNSPMADVNSYIDQTNARASIHIRYPETLSDAFLPYRTEAKLISQAVDYAGVGIYINGYFPEPYSNGGYKIYTMYNSQLKMSGPNYERLWTLSESVMERVRKDRRVGETIITPSGRNLWSMQNEGHNYQYIADYRTMWEKGLSLNDAYFSLYQLFPAVSAQFDMSIGSQNFPVKIRSSTQTPEYDNIKHSVLHFPSVKDQYFSDIFKSVHEKKIQWIDKKNQQFQFTLAWDYRGPWELSQQHVQMVLDQISLPPGYSLGAPNYNYLKSSEKRELNTMLIWVPIGLFIILAVLYNSLWEPLVIFLTVPFSLIGVFLFYSLTSKDFSADSYIGIIILLGIVVNDAIVLVDRISQCVRTKQDTTINLIIQAARERFRPILMTTITTVGGLVPLLFIDNGQTQLAGILSELGMIMITGLMSSTLFTISFIPVIYLLFHQIIYRNKDGIIPE